MPVVKSTLMDLPKGNGSYPLHKRKTIVVIPFSSAQLL